ncbi:hypothetical protein [Spirosoma sp. KCTC 42546]|uniref:hypothetical protein n=1 Tax=Spirosoma sp. KCTC 42546 TaxID=2520506 RepID=UPI00143DA8B2|nr:hypothetical protein [Spirosoma sp. KCTC 42546]
MSLREVKQRLATLSTERIRQTDEQLKQLRHRQQQQPSEANELMIQSLEYRREKLKR